MVYAVLKEVVHTKEKNYIIKLSIIKASPKLFNSVAWIVCEVSIYKVSFFLNIVFMDNNCIDNSQKEKKQELIIYIINQAILIIYIYSYYP